MNFLALASLGPLSAFFSSVTWAVGSSEYSKLSRTNAVFSVNFMRVVFALPIFFLIGVFTAGGLLPFFEELRAIPLHQIGWLAASMFASYGFGDSVFLWSTRALGVPSALAIGSIFPIWSALAGYFFEGQVLVPFQIAGLFIAIIGVVTIILNTPSPAPLVASITPASKIRWVFIRGVILALIVSFFWSLNTYAVTRGVRGLSISVANTLRMSIGFFMVPFFARAFGYKGRLVISAVQMRSFAWVFFVETILGTYFYMYAFAHSSLAIAATLTSLAPVLSVPVALILKLERFSVPRTLGICLVVIGLCFLVGTGIG